MVNMVFSSQGGGAPFVGVEMGNDINVQRNHNIFLPFLSFNFIFS